MGVRHESDKLGEVPAKRKYLSVPVRRNQGAPAVLPPVQFVLKAMFTGGEDLRRSDAARPNHTFMSRTRGAMSVALSERLAPDDAPQAPSGIDPRKPQVISPDTVLRNW
jgi:hypothetical protein